MLLKFIRVWLASALCVGGLLVIAIGGASEHSLEIGIPIFSAGASIWFFNLLVRVGHDGDADRSVEQAAREYFAEHGRWPDEKRSAGSQR